MSETTRRLYTRVAFCYHKQGLTQEQIAKNLHMSRQRVNRILSECLDLGIVEIRIHGESSAYLVLETILEERYGLTAVRVAGGANDDSMYTELGFRAGRYLTEIIRDSDIIGFSRGKTLSAMVPHISAIHTKNLVVVQLMGGWNDQHNKMRGDDIVHRLSERMNAKAVMLYAPVLLQDKRLRETFFREPCFLDSYQVIRSCTIAVLGIGQVSGEPPFPTANSDSAWVPKEAVGEICARFFDINGNPVSSEFDDRIIAVERNDLFQIPLRIGVAGSSAKLPAILGALRGGYINALITDAEMALALQTEKAT